ncbi:helix-turn-helix domain-containing protein, partial [Deinococcus misasensis]|uniref:helix-turn-helix domain-containing protein n=5 Tax=Deinococcus misasensis TaxID=392413 RepID=UPI0012F729AC
MGSKVKVRPLSETEVQHIQDQLKSKDAFTVRRSQILLASHEGQVVSQIARSLRIATQTVRNTFRAFEADGLASLHEQSHRPHTIVPRIDEAALQRLH